MSDRAKVMLGVLVVVVALVGWYTLNSDDSAPAGAPARSSFDPDGGGSPAARPPGGPAPAPVRDVVALRVGDLERTPHTYTPGRDPWRFVDPPPPPPPKPHVPTKAELDALRKAEEERQRLLAEAAARQAVLDAIPKPPPFTWTYLGSFGPASRRIAVFTDGKSIYDAQQGEILVNKFIVAQIGYESVDISFVGFPNVPPQRLPVGH